MRKVIICILIGVLLMAVAFGMGVCMSVTAKKSPFSKGTVGVIKIEGTIITADGIIKKISDAVDDDEIKALVIRVDSPGGAVAASQEIYNELNKADLKKPVVISMGNVAASGGYYVAVGGREIFANKGTVTGSIGVRMEHVNVGNLLNWAKIEHETLKSVKFKDIGSPDRKMTAEEKEILTSLLKKMHKQFVTDISEARNIPLEEVEKLADGRIYTGEEALNLSLVDKIGTLKDAEDSAAEFAGIKGHYNTKVLEKVEPWWLEFVTDDTNSLVGKLMKAYTNLDKATYLYQY